MAEMDAASLWAATPRGRGSGLLLSLQEFEDLALFFAG